MKFKLVKSADYKRGDLVLLEDGTEATIIGKSFGAGGVQTTDYYDIVTNDGSEHQTEVHKSEIVKKITSKKAIKSGESYGWVVNPEDAWDKLWLFVDAVGEKEALEALARAMGNDELSDNLAYIFRMYDFEEGCSDYGENEEDWEVDYADKYDTEEEAREAYKQAIKDFPEEEHVLYNGNDLIEEYKGKGK